MNDKVLPITFPADEKTDVFCGFKRHTFDFCGHEAWVVEPDKPLPGQRYWFALPEWPSAFSGRNGVRELLGLGYYMVHVKLFGHFANEYALGVMYRMYEFLQKNDFRSKGAFIGMSLGGLYSFRFAQAHPEIAACIYADAPVCDLGFCPEWNELKEGIKKAYGLKGDDELAVHPSSPVNALDRIAAADIPVLMILGMDDCVVNVESNGLLFAERFAAAGGNIELIKRPSWGHHPHGLDDTSAIVRFILMHTLNKF